MKIPFKPLDIPERYRKARMGHYIWCTLCNSNVTTHCKQSGKRLSSCQHGDHHRYQSKVYNPANKSMKPLKTWPKELRDYKEFAQLHMKLMQDSEVVITNTVKMDRPAMLLDCEAIYLDWLSDKGVPGFERKNNTDKYINLQLQNLKVMNLALKQSGVAIDYLLITELSRTHVGIIHDYLEAHYAPKTYNDKMATYRAFFKYLIKNDYPVRNPFDDVKSKSTKARKRILSLDLFDRLIQSITPEAGIVLEKKGGKRIGRKQLYRDWLKDIWSFALWSGCRPEEIQTVKVSDIKSNHIQVQNFKVARGKKTSDEIRMVVLIHELQQLVTAIIERDHLTSDHYLLAHEESNRSQVMRVASRAFSHYIRQITDEEYVMYDLRNTYATMMYRKFGDKFGGRIGLHGHTDTTIKHYVNDMDLLDEWAGIKVGEK